MTDRNAAGDLAQMLGELIRYGAVESVTLKPPRCTVLMGGVVSGPLPWFGGRAGDDLDWDPPSIGEQCLLLCPEGDIGLGVVLLGGYSDRFPAPDDQPRKLRKFRDGALIGYDPETHTLSAVLPDGGLVEIASPERVEVRCERALIKANVEIEGDVSVKGDLTATGKIDAGKDVSGRKPSGAVISLVAHTHTGVTPGGGVSGPPPPLV